MKRVFIILLSGLFMAILLFGACDDVVYPPVERPVNVSYQYDVQPIFDKNCASCHGGGSLNLKPESSYNSLVNGGFVDTDNPEESELMQMLDGDHKDKVTEEEKLTILSWIIEGAKNN